MTKEEIKQQYSMRDILAKYGLNQPNRAGFISCPFHTEKTASMKIYKDSFHCFGCGANGDIFSFIGKYLGLEFKDVFKELGGEYEHSFTAHIKANRARNEQRQRIAQEQRKKAELRQINNLITVYRNLIRESKPMSDKWTYYMNKLQYQLYLLEFHSEKR